MEVFEMESNKTQSIHHHETHKKVMNRLDEMINSKMNNKIKITKKPELLMPAGNLEKMKIGVMSGADAIYFGALKFNMRQTANNFSIEEIKEGINFCHANGAKAYMTLNIALKEEEVEEAIELAKEAYEIGVDALIVQDLGLVMALRKLLPSMELHASTQLTCNNVQGAEFLADLGFKKIVLAREMTLEEIRVVVETMHKRNVEVEVFVHGAECFSYSGQCLFSSFAFNKSGNRGRCLQPCRLEYATNVNINGRILSMKDLCTYSELDKIIECGIDSFKVEGRLKSNEYIQNVAKVYRKQIDNYFGAEGELKKGQVMEMKKSYLRDHGSLYFFDEEERTTIDTLGSLGLKAVEVTGFRGKNPIVKLFIDLNVGDKLTKIVDAEYNSFFVRKIISHGKEVRFARENQSVEIVLDERPFLNDNEILYMTTPKQFNPGKTLLMGYDLDLVIKKNQKIKGIIRLLNLQMKRSNQINFELDFIPEIAKEHPTTIDVLKEKVFKEFYFFTPKEIKCDMDQNLFIPLSRLNDLKKIIIDKTMKELFSMKNIDNEKFKSDKEKLLRKEENKDVSFSPKEQKVFIFCEDYKKEVIEKTQGLKCEKVFYYDDERKNDFPKDAMVKPNNIQSTIELEKFEAIAKEKKWTVVCANIGAIQIALKNNLEFWIDREMNCFNSLSLNFFRSIGAKKVIPSVELTMEEIMQLSPRKDLAALVFYYPLLMTSKAYALKNIFGKTKFIMRDRKDYDYRIRMENKLLKLYNPHPVDMLYEIEKFSKFNSVIIDLKETNTPEAIMILKYYLDKIDGKNPKKKSKFTRGHYDKPVL
ncbi:MAG: DUF3656 domain-containing protein [Candidatus ainarchaeum sp.]|nr:DUF3656 domain-containing protein [Candidatus ainarchaeum sp.]